MSSFHKKLRYVDGFKSMTDTCSRLKLGSNKPLASRLERRARKRYDENIVELELYDTSTPAWESRKNVIAAHCRGDMVYLTKR